jgi:hypothetical protein
VIETRKKMETQEEMKKRKHDEYLERKNTLFGMFAGLLNELAKAGDDGMEIAKNISRGNTDVIADILGARGRVLNITPKRFQGTIKRCLYHHQKDRGVFSFYARRLYHGEKDDGAYHHDLFWIDLERFMREVLSEGMSDESALENSRGCLANTWVYAFPPLVIHEDKFILLNRHSEDKWIALWKIMSSSSCDLHDNFRNASDFLRNKLIWGNDEERALVDSYILECLDSKGHESPFYDTETVTGKKARWWKEFPKLHIIHEIERYNLRIKFFLFFGSVWMTHKVLEK